MTIRILVVDDARMMRAVLSRRLNQEPDFEVIGAAADAYEARDILVRERPDVVTLDLGLPRMDGLTFLRKYMAVIPTPTVVVSAATGRDQRVALAAVAAGAVGVLSKDQLFGEEARGDRLIDEVRAAAAARVDGALVEADGHRASLRNTTVSGVRGGEGDGAAPRLVALGASTGGVLALHGIFERLSEPAPPMVVVQHMPSGFTAALAEQLDQRYPLRFEEASDERRLEPGLVLVAPGGRHLEVREVRGGLVAHVHDGPRVSNHRPSVDVLFHSVARTVGMHAAGVILTGMGSDGAEGLLAMRRQGALTVAQDAATSVVNGMPGAAVRMCAAAHVAPLQDIAGLLSFAHSA